MQLLNADDRRLLAAIEDYEANHRHPSRPRFRIHEPETTGSLGIKGSWAGSDPSYMAGCYAIFSDTGEILYVGKASHTKSVGDRLVRFRYRSNDWNLKPATVRIIEVIEPFEAASLEEFLIARLRPLYNKHGRAGQNDLEVPQNLGELPS